MPPRSAVPSASDAGQSLIEFALSLPILLLILLGVADLARGFYFTVTIAGAAREAAAYAAMHPSADAATVRQHGCDAAGLASFGAPCPAELVVTCLTACPTNGADSSVRVTYSFRLVSAYLVDRIFTVNPIVLRSDSSFPGTAP